MTIQEFCDKHKPCEEYRKWMSDNCLTMDEVWQTASPNIVGWLATRDGVLDAKTLRLFAVSCVNRINIPLFNSDCMLPEHKAVLEVAMRRSEGNATDDELNAVAGTVKTDGLANRYSMVFGGDMLYAAYTALKNTVRIDPRSAAWGAMIESCYSRGCTPSSDAARNRMLADHAAWLRANAKPTFA